MPRDTKDLKKRGDEEIHPDEIIKIIRSEPKDEELEKSPKRGRTPLPKGIFWGIVGLVALFLVGSIVSFYVFRGRVAGSISANLDTLRAGVIDLQNFDPESAEQRFSSLQDISPHGFGEITRRLTDLFKGGGGALASFSELAKQLVALSRELNALELNAFNFLASGRGEAFVAELKSVRGTVGAIDASASKLSGAASFTRGFSSLGAADFYLSLKSQIEGAKKFLDAFVPWLSDPAPRHVLVLLHNPSEIRPAGGFLGSYADVMLAGGNITDVSVHDIADVDIAFTAKIIPPRPLWPIVKKWRPADANWFFDFPTSASKTIAFFEASDLYAKSSTTFDAAVAVSPKVVSDLLAMTGPIAIGKPTTTFSADNFLVQIQKIVQKGQATDATYPKQVLRDLSGALFIKLASITGDGRRDLLHMMRGWAEKKDIMIYFRNRAVENFLDANGASGAVYELPQRFNGDYLAVVDANVGGGKSDLYVSSTVSYSSQINSDGTLGAHLTITRKHNGAKSPYQWYKTTNQNYVQVFLPAVTSLTNAAGGVQKKITAPVNYATAGYPKDPLVSAIESTEQTIFGYPAIAWHEEAGKKVFTTWTRTAVGETTLLTLDYTRHLFLPPAADSQYQFVFEKQAGTNRRYKLEINAPLGYVFIENGLPSFDYESDDPPGRLIVNLTLTKLAQ